MTSWPSCRISAATTVVTPSGQSSVQIKTTVVAEIPLIYRWIILTVLVLIIRITFRPNRWVHSREHTATTLQALWNPPTFRGLFTAYRPKLHLCPRHIRQYNACMILLQNNHTATLQQSNSLKFRVFQTSGHPENLVDAGLWAENGSNFKFSKTKNLIRVATWTAVVGSERDSIDTWANASHVRTGFRAGRSVFWQHRPCSPVSSAGTSATTSVLPLSWIVTTWWAGVEVSMLASINEANLRRARLVLRWVTMSRDQFPVPDTYFGM